MSPAKSIIRFIGKFSSPVNRSKYVLIKVAYTICIMKIFYCYLNLGQFRTILLIILRKSLKTKKIYSNDVKSNKDKIRPLACYISYQVLLLRRRQR